MASTGKMTDKEMKTYTKAFRASDGKRMTGRTGAAEKSVADQRKAEMNRLAAKMRKTGPVAQIMADKKKKTTPLVKKKKKVAKKKASFTVGGRNPRHLGQF